MGYWDIRSHLFIFLHQYYMYRLLYIYIIFNILDYVLLCLMSMLVVQILVSIFAYACSDCFDVDVVRIYYYDDDIILRWGGRGLMNRVSAHPHIHLVLRSLKTQKVCFDFNFGGSRAHLK